MNNLKNTELKPASTVELSLDDVVTIPRHEYARLVADSHSLELLRHIRIRDLETSSSYRSIRTEDFILGYSVLRVFDKKDEDDE